MPELKNTLSIIEWQSFDIEDIDKKIQNTKKAGKIFNELKDFALYDKNRAFLAIDKRGTALKAQNYVGLIETKSGFCLEILPKIYDKDSIDDSLDEKELEKTKNLLIKMLKTLKNFPTKTSNLSSLNTSKTPLLEVFIQMFLNELITLIKKGIKSNYQAIEENRFYLKGKLLFSQNIKYNLAHQERFYTRADEYSPNIPQNRLIKNVLEMFSKIPLSSKTQSLLRECYFTFDGIIPSQNLGKDFNSCRKNRSLKHYETILAWCEVFLKQKNFTPYVGDSVAIALLFDMNYLFESYIAFNLKLHCKEWNISVQDSGKYLLQNGERDFCELRPDIVAKRKIPEQNEEESIILDTKWKKIEKQSDISPSDIHQMWAYVSKYKSKKAILLYPKIKDTKEMNFSFKPENLKNPKSSLHIAFVDLLELLEKTEATEIKRIFQKFFELTS